MSTSHEIIKYIEKNKQASGKELSDYLYRLTPRAIRKQLKNLLEKGVLRKIGKPPRVYYLLNETRKQKSEKKVNRSIKTTIDKRYLYISAAGEYMPGWEGFVVWCEKTGQDIVKTANEYINTLKKFDKLRRNNLLDGMPKMKKTFDNVFLNKLFYLDFYSIERFGKTRLGQMLLYSKQSQNTQLIRKIIEEIRPRIISLIKKEKIDGVLFIPPTVKREVQFMKELERMLQLSTRSLSITKIKTDIVIPQKTLSKLSDRIENASSTMIINETGHFRNILLIDDAVGSGATLNEVARKIKEKHLVKGNIIGLAITGSFKGFDVISEV